MTQIAAPAVPIRCCIPTDPTALSDLITETGSFVQHRVDQRLLGHRQLCVVSPLGQHCGQTAAGAVATDHDPLPVDPEFVGLDVQPLQCGETVVDGRGIGVFGCEPVTIAEDRYAEIGGKFGSERCGAVR